jgi:hypothetical protein
MFSWIYENLATILISAALIAICAAIIVSKVRARRQGKSSCGCGCSNCAMNGTCHSHDALPVKKKTGRKAAAHEQKVR